MNDRRPQTTAGERFLRPDGHRSQSAWVDRSKLRKRIAMVGTGGSIATWARSSLDLVDYGRFGQVLPIDELIQRIPEMAGLAEFVTVSLREVYSEAIGPIEWCEFAQTLQSLSIDESIDGIVMVHGTSSLEETAWFLDLVIRPVVPIVLVGAQRPPNGLGSDAGSNLVNAVQAACDPRVAGLGVVAVLNGEIHAARDVTKASTYRLDAFSSGELGPLGFVDPNGEVVLYRVPHRRLEPFTVSGISLLPRVDIVTAYAGADGVPIDAVVKAGARGIVVAGMAPGVCASAQLGALKRARDQGVSVVFSTRAGRGRVVVSAFSTENDFSTAGNLTPQKARILLMLCLAFGEDDGQIRDRFRVS